jgi:hypothetical protein
VAALINIAHGHDGTYPFKTSGTVDGPVIIGERGARYYLSTAEKGDEARPWVGNGAAEIGFQDGDVARREGLEFCGQFLGPRDASALARWRSRVGSRGGSAWSGRTDPRARAG